jgi:hypothetical protein
MAEHGSSPYINHFIQPDTIIPNPADPQSWNRFAYAKNNPIKFNDPSGHKACSLIDSGECDETEEKIIKFIDRTEDYLINKNGTLKNKHKDNVVEAMSSIVTKAAMTFGNDWNTFLDVTTYVFTGYYGHGYESMWLAHQSAKEGFSGYFDGALGFHPDFVDESNQVRHFWAGFATAVDPYDDNPYGIAVATFGNNYHDFAWDKRAGNDAVTVVDYKLTLTAIDIAKQVGNQIMIPSGLAAVLNSRLGVNGPGYTGGYIDPAQWYTPDN